ncbi:Beta-galactosidase trimerisation domain-containing protein [Nitrosomonas sp. Nm34]|nr:Beta-galactosidase trimerisation domain-containing protein [Nitrosomonas sp. Nm34]
MQPRRANYSGWEIINNSVNGAVCLMGGIISEYYSLLLPVKMHIEKIKWMDLKGLTVSFILALLVIFPSLSLTNTARAAEPDAFNSWVKTARIGGAAVFTGMTAQEMNQIISNMVSQKVTVIEADSNLSDYLTDAQFEQELALMHRFATEVHKRDLKVVWYYPSLEVLTPNGKNIEHTMFKDHPDWVQIGIEGQPNVFYGGSGRVHWVAKDEESAWMSPQSPYKDYFLDRVQKIAATGVDGLWLDVPLFNDIGVEWAGFDPYAIAKFKTDTGLDAPVAENWTDPIWRRWIAWRHQEIALFLRDVASAGRAINPEFPLIVETVTLDYNAATVIALDGADLKNLEGITHVWEIDALSDDNGMRSSSEDDWISLIAMNKFARAASGKKPSWVFTYGQLSDDAELVMAETLATRNNPYETKIPQMTTSVGADYRTRMFGWTQENSPYLFEAQPGARVAVLYSSPSRDYVDKAAGVGLYTDTTSNDPLWWTKTPSDSAYERQYLAEYRGMVKMLVHQHIPFEIVVNPVDSAELNPYDTVLLPDVQAISDTEAAILRQYVQNGGSLIITGANPTALDEYGTARADYALANLLGFSKQDALPAEKENTFGKGSVRFFSASLGKNYFVSSDATSLQQLSGAVQATSTIPLTTDADRRVHFELSQLGNHTILQLVNFIGVNGSFTVEPTTFSVNLKIPDGKEVTGVALTSPDSPNTPGLRPLDYTASNQQISFNVMLNQYALVVVSYDDAQAPSNNHTPIASK